jgi:putative endonuclease
MTEDLARWRWAAQRLRPAATERRFGAHATWIVTARDLLLARGLKLIAQNYRCRSGELDLVLLDQGVLAVVEVRLRRSLKFGGASVSIDHEKRRRIIQATRHLILTRRELRHLPLRFDVVAFDLSTGRPEPEWIKGAFDAC